MELGELSLLFVVYSVVYYFYLGTALGSLNVEKRFRRKQDERIKKKGRNMAFLFES